ncbi:magnesium/cobalt transporter CorA [Candidatus Woesearchaeota archaeon]|nr:magnesium/cobalt transporter CorA [Candidatus Woesearchaeota archaeon]
MITVWEVDGKEVRATSLEKWRKSASWVDCVQLSHTEQEALSQVTEIPLIQLKECINFHKRPRVVVSQKYTMIVFRGVNQDLSHVHAVVIALFVFKNFIVTLHEKPIRALNLVRDIPKAQKAETLREPFVLCYRVLEVVMNGFFQVMEEIEKEVDIVEGQAVRESSKMVPQRLFLLKKRLIYLQKALSADRDVLASIERLNIHEKLGRENFRDLYSDNAHLLDLVVTYRDVLTSVMDTFQSSINIHLNKVVKTLTVLAAYILVPTLITGIYGMNFRFMPELSWKWGYLFSLVLMVLSIVVFHIYFKRKGWLA